MNEEQTMRLLQESDAVLNGHFILSSGKHSRIYLQCAKALSNPKIAEAFGAEIASKISHLNGSIVVSPAMGGLIIGHEVARALGVKFLFLERVNGVFELRRGFSLSNQERVVVIEDVFTTGKSTVETIEVVKSFGASVVGAASIVDRSNVNLQDAFECVTLSLLRLNVETFDPNNLPIDLKSLRAIKPGSRFLTKP